MTARRRAAPGVDESHGPRLGRLASAALLLSASFVLSRVLGLLRMSVIAGIFGNSASVQAYVAAFRIPDTMFTLVSGGALASAFVPMFAGLLEQGEEDEAWKVASTVLNTVSLALAILAAIAFVFAPQVMGLLVQGFTPAERGQTVDLTRIMLLQPIFLGASAIVTAMLQTYNRFVLTATAPLVYNLSVILAALLFGPSGGIGVLAWAVVAGALAQLVIQLPGLWPELSMRYRIVLDWASEGPREVLRLFGPRVVGLAAFQGMLLITLYLAAGLPQGMVGAINYAWTLMYAPVGALGTAAATAIFPTLSRRSAAEDVDAMRRTVNRTLRLILFLALPAAMGLIVLRRPIVNLLFNHGTAWTFMATEQTAFALLFFAMALPSLTIIEVLARVFYAMKDTRTPVRIAVVAVVLDAVLSILLVHLLPRASGQGGLAVATAVANTIQAVWLAVALDERMQGIGRRSLLLTLRDGAISSLVMGMLLYVTLDPLTAVLPQQGVGVLVIMTIEVALGLVTFGGVAHLLGAPELLEVRSLLPGQK